MTILGPQGKPINPIKKWEEQDSDEKLFTLRTGIVLTMQCQEQMMKILQSISNGVETIIEAIEEEANGKSGQGREDSDGEEEVGDGVEHGSSDEVSSGPDETVGRPE
jgi:hypothetical protein